MIKIKDESGKALYTVTDEDTEPTPTPECLECGCPSPKKEETPADEEKKKD